MGILRARRALYTLQTHTSSPHPSETGGARSGKRYLPRTAATTINTTPSVLHFADLFILNQQGCECGFGMRPPAPTLGLAHTPLRRWMIVFRFCALNEPLVGYVCSCLTQTFLALCLNQPFLARAAKSFSRLGRDRKADIIAIFLPRNTYVEVMK